jgi:hypothetical protein
MSLSTSTNVFPLGPTFAILATTTSAQTYVTAGSNNIASILVENLDTTNDVFVNWSLTASTVTATLPTTGIPQTGIAIQNNSSKIIQVGVPGGFDSNITVAANAVTGTATVHITPVA